MVVENAIEAFNEQQAPPPAYFYCSRNPDEPGRSDPEKILASIVRQFFYSLYKKQLLSPTFTTSQSHEVEGLSSDALQPLQLQDSYKLLLDILHSYPTAVIIIDALDECHPETRYKLLDKLQDILRQSPTLVKIFVSSRNDQDITDKLRDYSALELSSDFNSVDLNRFVEYHTELLIKQGKLLHSSYRKDEISQKIIQKLSSGAHGVLGILHLEKLHGLTEENRFRWAALQLEALCDIVTENGVLERLERLPPTLNHLYQEILDKVQQYSSKAEQVYSKNTLAWLLCSRERLNLEQFLAAISTTDRPTESPRKDYVLKIFRGLVVFDQNTDSFRFAHFSVKEFVEAQPAYCASTINGIVAGFCLTTLITGGARVQENFLYSYANYYWASHCEDAADERGKGSLRILLEKFLSNTTLNHHSVFGINTTFNL